MLFAVSFLAFLFTFVLTLALTNKIYEPQVYIQKRLYQMADKNNDITLRQVELSLPLFKRTIEPLLNKTSAALKKQGLLKMVFVILFSASLYIFFTILGVSKFRALFFLIVGGILGYYIPDLIKESKKRRIKEDVEKRLPEVLDLLTVCVEAGLGFDGAMVKVVEKTKGVLAEEMARVINEVRMGKPRKEALRDMAERLSVDELSNFVGSIIMAEQLGIGIGNVLRLQSKEIRSKRRQRVEEMAMKAPVKMLLPIVFFIFPAIFIILLGPAALQLMRIFTK